MKIFNQYTIPTKSGFSFGILIYLLFANVNLSAQITLPMTEVTSMYKKGQYDIRMVSSPVIHPVWMKYGAANMDVIKAITTEEQLQLGTITTHNNALTGAAGAVFP
jgi:hypothetical protein